MPKTGKSEPQSVAVSTQTPPALPASFESAMEELESIVARMESSNLSLEDSLAAHKRGLELARYCQDLLARAQQQVQVLEENTLKTLDEVSPDEP